ncbi:MAG: hypothetical protein J5625_05430 [Lachnospiraceae bacterium]|nr:hypothetical protein [Lachnospiraceae bacterium]
MTKEEYLNTLKDQIRDKHAKEFVCEEYKTHIEDQIDAYVNDGMNNEQATIAAVKDMGDPVNVGASLDRIHRPHMEWKFLVFIIAISLISLAIKMYLNIYSYGGSINFFTLYFNQWTVQLITTIIGIFFMLFFYRLDYTVLNGKSRIIGICFLFVITLFAGVFGQKHSGILSHLYIGHWATYLKSFILLFIPIFGGILYEYRGKGISAIIKIILWMVAPLISLRIMDFNALFIIWVIVFSEITLLWIAIGKNWFTAKKHISIPFSILPFICFLFIYVLPFIQNALLRRIQVAVMWRFEKYFFGKLSPETLSAMEKIFLFIANMIDRQKISNFTNVKNVFQNSNYFGSSVSALSYMDNKPIYRSDLLLGKISAHFGIVLMLGIVILTFILSAYILYISIRQKNKLGFIVGIACSLALGFESITNILTVLGIVGLSDSILPFIADGGGILICHYIFAGLVLSVYRYKDIRKEKKQIKVNKVLSD